MLSYTTPFWTRLFLILSLLLPTLTLAVPVEHATIEPRANVRDIPGVAELKGQIQSWGVATRLPSVFYTNWPTGLNDAQTWGRDMFDEDIGATKATWKFAIWGRLVSGEWLTSVTSELQDQMEAAKYPASRIKSYQDVLSKNLCQALGETVKGDVYLIVGDDVVPDNNWDVNTAWGGWEYPALTRNPDVDRIIRVDPSECQDGEAIEGKVIWKKGQKASTQKPKGKQGPTTPRKVF